MSVRFPAVLPVLLLLLASPARAQSALAWFVHERDIHFDTEEVLLGSINDLSVGPRGELAILDDRTGKAWLFDANGRLMHGLDPEACHPGFSGNPESVSIGSGHIFLSTSSATGYLFNGVGECVSNSHESYQRLWPVTLSGDSTLIGVHRRKGLPSRLVRATLTGRPISETEIPPGDFPNADYRVQARGLAVGDGVVFFAPSVSPVLYAVSGNRVSEISRGKYFKAGVPQRDYPDRVDPSQFKAIGQAMAGTAYNIGLWIIDQGDLLLEYQESGLKNTLVVLNPDKPDSAMSQQIDFFLFQFHDGLGYEIVMPDADDASMPNPHLRVYRWVGPGGS